MKISNRFQNVLIFCWSAASTFVVLSSSGCGASDPVPADTPPVAGVPTCPSPQYWNGSQCVNPPAYNPPTGGTDVIIVSTEYRCTAFRDSGSCEEHAPGTFWSVGCFAGYPHYNMDECFDEHNGRCRGAACYRVDTFSNGQSRWSPVPGTMTCDEDDPELCS